jgi:hypothetical protein
MVFACRRAWIESTDLETILPADGYRRLANVSDVVPGDLVLYKNYTGAYSHVGVVLDRCPVISNDDLGILVLSKWGKEGEYVHPAEKVPLLCGKPVEFWTERETLP